MKIFKKTLIAFFALMFLFIRPTGHAATTTAKPSVTNTFFGVTDDVCTFWKAIFDFAIQIAGGIALVVVAIGGVLYLVSAGSTDKQKTAKDIMYGAGFGMVLALTSWVLFTVLNPYLLECKIEVKQAKLYYKVNSTCDDYQKYDSEDECYQAEDKCSKSYGKGKCVENTQRTKNTDVTKLNDEDKEKWCCPSECGKGLVHLMENWRGTCFGACHCAFFVSTILFESGCPKSIFDTGANNIFGKLRSQEYKDMGWECFEGNEGIEAGDVVHKPSHIEIAVSSTRTMGANTGNWTSEFNYMGACSDNPLCIPDQPKMLNYFIEETGEGYYPEACDDCSPSKEKDYMFGKEQGPASGFFCDKSLSTKCKAQACKNNQCVNDTGSITKVYEYCRPPN